MELIFAPIDEVDGIDEFTMEVSLSDSVPQIKQKIKELKGIPISRQSLLFVLPDDFNLRHSQIVDGSTIYLYLHDEPPTTTGRRQCPLLPARRNTILHRSPSQQAASSSSSRSICDQSGQQTDTGAVERPPSAPSSNQTPIKTHPSAANQPPTTIHQQSPIHPTGGVERQSVVKRGREDIAESSGTSSTLTADDMARARNVRPTATLTVVVVYREKQSAVVVRPEEEVSELRGKPQLIDWSLPPRCKFVSNHRVMNANRSFAFNRVREGDVIQASRLD